MNKPLSIPQGYRPYDENLQITRLAPGEKSITFEWADYSDNTGDNQYSVFFKCDHDRTFNEGYPIDVEQKTCTIDGFESGETYCMYLIKENTAGKKYSYVRRFQTGATPGTVINYIHPNDKTYITGGSSPASPSIVKLPSGRILASHDVYERDTEHNLSKLFYSDDNGESFHFLTDLCSCFWGKLFYYDHAVYMLASANALKNLIIAKSMDEGQTWSAPTIILSSTEEFKVHKAPMPVVFKAGKMYAAIELMPGERGGTTSCVVSGDLNDLMNAENYTVSEPCKFSYDWPGTIQDSTSSILIEGNMVISPQGKLYNILRYNVRDRRPMTGFAAVLAFDETTPKKAETFHSIIDFQGSHTKFAILYNASKKCYYSLVNRANVPESDGSQRNILSLVKSDDLFHWEFVRDVLNYQDNGWHEDLTKVAFQYVDFIFDGLNEDTILAVSRTAINGARDFHDNNYMTFHKVQL